MKCFDILIFFFSALFHLGLFARFHSNSWRVSLTLKFICVVYLLFVRQQWFIKLCISSTLNNGRECLIGPCSHTATILTHLIITALTEGTQLCRATFTPLGEEVARQTSAPWAGVASSSPPKSSLPPPLSAHITLTARSNVSVPFAKLCLSASGCSCHQRKTLCCSCHYMWSLHFLCFIAFFLTFLPLVKIGLFILRLI